MGQLAERPGSVSANFLCSDGVSCRFCNLDLLGSVHRLPCSVLFWFVSNGQRSTINGHAHGENLKRAVGVVFCGGHGDQEIWGEIVRVGDAQQKTQKCILSYTPLCYMWECCTCSSASGTLGITVFAFISSRQHPAVQPDRPPPRPSCFFFALVLGLQVWVTTLFQAFQF